MSGINLPEELADMLRGYSCEINSVGCSSSGIYRYRKDDEALYLKVSEASNESRREYDILYWLADKLPVPEVKYWYKQDGLTYLLMAQAEGHMACDCPADEIRIPYEQTVRLLGEGLLMLQALPVGDCPFENRLDHKLKEALHNIKNNLVDMADFEEDNEFETPMDLYHWLMQNKPSAEELSFVHGDFCLPNVFIDDSRVTGFIDLGRAGTADKWQDIALCVRSLRHNLKCVDHEPYIKLLFNYLKIEPDWDKIHYYVMLDELF